MIPFLKAFFHNVCIFGDMNDFRIVVNISILLTIDICWSLDGATLKTALDIVFQKLL